MKFIKKPDVVEAIQWTGNNLAEVIKILGDCYGGNPIGDNLRVCNTLGICQIAELNDWILKDEFGHLCCAYKPDDFKKIYIADSLYEEIDKLSNKIVVESLLDSVMRTFLKLKPVKLDILTEEKLKAIGISEEFLKYAEETSKTGLIIDAPDDRIEYEKRIVLLCNEELKRLAAEAQLAHDVDTLKGAVKQ
jgi:hypothetical protein